MSKQPVPPLRRRLALKSFETLKGAERWARSFDHARTFSSLPLLEVERQQDGFVVVNPDANTKARPR